MQQAMFALCAVIGYLLGSISCGIIFGWTFGKMDIRTVGSKSTGTTNVLRTLGVGPSIVTFVGDALKGFLAVVIGRAIAGTNGAMLCGICAVVGHNWPIYYHFKGGKGIATSFGLILAMDPWIALILIVLQIAILAATKYMSVASIATSVCYTLLTICFHGFGINRVLFALTVTLLALVRHRENIKRLRNHCENKLDFSRFGLK